METNDQPHPGYIDIKLAPAEAELWDWAVDPMDEFWGHREAEERALDGDRSYEVGEAIQLANDGVGRIANDPSVADDLIYRVETQIPDMAVTEIEDHDPGSRERMKAVADIGTGKRIASKVRKAFGMEG